MTSRMYANLPGPLKVVQQDSREALRAKLADLDRSDFFAAYALAEQLCDALDGFQKTALPIGVKTDAVTLSTHLKARLNSMADLMEKKP